MVSRRCLKCKYHCMIGEHLDELACYYNGITGRRRNSPAGDRCDKYESGSITYRYKETAAIIEKNRKL